MHDVRVPRWTTAALLICTLASPLTAGGTDPKYVGSVACSECHRDNFDLWKSTLHANVLQDAKEHPEAVLGDFSAEDISFKKEDVLYTVGSHWDQRYMTRINGEFYVLPKLWAVQSRQWRPYNVFSWKQRPWSRFCAGCHVTGYNPGKGNYIEMRIGCESCHGPGEAHGKSEKAGDIVNPANLPEDLRDMICAACHVRGKDLSGQYYFPVGYRPGMDLGKYYAPIDMEDGEEPSAAIARLYRQWAVDRQESGRGKCEVCGIYGSSDKIPQMTDNVMKYCLKCHEFGDNLTVHTNHPSSVKLVCLDCHRPKPFTAQKEKVDVHSPRYYRIHQESCYDEEIDVACIRCHTHKNRDRGWATREILIVWKKLPPLDH